MTGRLLQNGARDRRGKRSVLIGHLSTRIPLFSWQNNRLVFACPDAKRTVNWFGVRIFFLKCRGKFKVKIFKLHFSIYNRHLGEVEDKEIFF